MAKDNLIDIIDVVREKDNKLEILGRSKRFPFFEVKELPTYLIDKDVEKCFFGDRLHHITCSSENGKIISEIESIDYRGSLSKRLILSLFGVGIPLLVNHVRHNFLKSQYNTSHYFSNVFSYVHGNMENFSKTNPSIIINYYLKKFGRKYNRNITYKSNEDNFYEILNGREVPLKFPDPNENLSHAKRLAFRAVGFSMEPDEINTDGFSESDKSLTDVIKYRYLNRKIDEQLIQEGFMERLDNGKTNLLCKGYEAFNRANYLRYRILKNFNLNLEYYAT